MRNSAKDAELLKHRLSIELEARKWDYRKRELQYLEAGQHLRSLNQLMWQVPGLAIAVTGGLWYGATTVGSDAPRTWVLGFAAVLDVLIVVILWRLRALIQVHIDHQADFAGQNMRQGRWRRTVITCWTLALIAAAIVSVAAACNPAALVKKQVTDALALSCDAMSKALPQSPLPMRHTVSLEVQTKASTQCIR